jgi:putative transposase
LIPRFGGGRPGKLTKEEKCELLLLLGERDDWTLEEIRDLIQGEYDVMYSFSRLRDVLKSLSMKHAKPFMRDYRRP